MQLYTLVEYRYRDYGNYKFHGEFLLTGELSFRAARKSLYEQRMFIPHKVGIPNLIPSVMNEDDHWLHEITSISVSEEASVEPLMSSKEFLKRIKSCNTAGWLLLCPWV